MLNNLNSGKHWEDIHGVVRIANHNHAPIIPDPADAASPNNIHALAAEYLREQLPKFGIAGHPVLEDVPVNPDPLLKSAMHRHIVKRTMDTSVFAYAQTYFGIPLWRSGVTMVVRHQPLSVLNSSSSVHTNPIELMFPENFASVKTFNADKFKENLLSTPSNQVLLKKLHIGDSQLWIYKYDAAERLKNVPGPGEHHPLFGGGLLEGATLTLPDTPPEIKDGEYYIVHEVLFTTYRIPWRALVEIETSTILYLELLVAGLTINGMVFTLDPITTGNSNLTPEIVQMDITPIEPTTLNLTGEYITLRNLDTSTSGNQGTYRNREAIPTEAHVAEFLTGDYMVPASLKFAAVSAYYHTNTCFQKLLELGFSTAADSEQTPYWGDQTLPLPVDCWNATGSGNGGGYTVQGIGMNSLTGGGDVQGFEFGQSPNTQPMAKGGNDARTVWHEFSHAMLLWHVGRLNLGFSHSCGDALAVILCDPIGKMHVDDRGLSFPWTNLTGPSNIPRRHDHTESYYQWGGDYDLGDNDYGSEQILSSTMFRFYCAIGGDDLSLEIRQEAADIAAYLIFRTVSNLTPNSVAALYDTDSGGTLDFETSLESADQGSWVVDGGLHRVGGAYHKVIRWAFEKQGLFNGAPPAVDLYIEDGRGGEYPYQQVWWFTHDIWNRNQDDGTTEHTNQLPVVGTTNYAYVILKNRGTETARNVVVQGFHTVAAIGAEFPTVWAEMTPPSSFPDVPPDSTSNGDIIAGPFEWVPQDPHVMNMLFMVSNDEDKANMQVQSGVIDANSRIAAPIHQRHLVQHDNNIAQLLMYILPPPPISDIIVRTTTVSNPNHKPAEAHIRVVISSQLQNTGWTYYQLPTQDAEQAGGFPADPDAAVLTLDGQGSTSLNVSFVHPDAWAKQEKELIATPNSVFIIGEALPANPVQQQAQMQQQAPVQADTPDTSVTVEAYIGGMLIGGITYWISAD